MLLDKDLSGVTQVNLRWHNIRPGGQGALILWYANASVTVDDARPDISLGRGEDCDLVIRERLASRRHASIRLLRSHFYLVDHSLNGTFVVFESGEEVHVLHRELLLGSPGKLPPATPREEARVPRDLPLELQGLYATPLLTPAKERALFLKFNFYKYEFVTLRRKLDPEFVRARHLNALEALLKRAIAAKNAKITGSITCNRAHGRKSSG